MIRSFRHKGLRLLFETGNSRGVQSVHARKRTDILDLLNAAMNPGDMNFPGSLLHPLKGSLKGYWAVRVSGNWRIIFRFEKGDALDVDYVDYH
ncbi:MAG: type II toxin-antitoxin system RelE/ParE family toxin [Tepidisphaeraceae bacterium]